MGDGYQYLDIVLFAVIAGFLILRLRSVLGRRTGNERPRDPFVPPKAESAAENVVALPRGRPSVGAPPANAPAPVSAPGARVKAADPRFDETAFLAGARSAFEIIVNAFAKGDTAALQPLLSEAVYASFTDAIRARLTAHETFETNLLTIKAVELAERRDRGRYGAGHREIRVRSDQCHARRRRHRCRRQCRSRGGEDRSVDLLALAPLPRPQLDCSSPRTAREPPRDMTHLRPAMAGLLVALAVLAGCARAPDKLTLTRTTFAALPGWENDDPGAALAAFDRSCVPILRRQAAARNADRARRYRRHGGRLAIALRGRGVIARPLEYGPDQPRRRPRHAARIVRGVVHPLQGRQ